MIEKMTNFIINFLGLIIFIVLTYKEGFHWYNLFIIPAPQLFALYSAFVVRWSKVYMKQK